MSDFFRRPYTLPRPYSIRIGSRLLDLSRPKVMGILNLSQDSFYSGSRIPDLIQLVRTAGNMLENGAAFLDLGGMSSRPGANELTTDEEIRNIIPAIKNIRKEFPEAVLSVDTYRLEVAEAVLSEGADLINDIRGGRNSELVHMLAKQPVPYIIMHSRGPFSELHQPQSYTHLVTDVIIELQNGIKTAQEAGVRDVIVDPGFGFSKNQDQNFELFASLEEFSMLECPLLIGISRKSMIYKTLDCSPEEALNGTTALHMAALQKGAHILRVHDVKEAIQTITLFEKLCLPES
jgi:dihydropteroate synthase